MTNTSTVCSKIRLSCKCIQLILACVCIGLFAHTGLPHSVEAEVTLMAITFGGYIIILSGVILGFCSEERVPKKIDLLYTLVGLALFIAAGSVSISRFNDLKSIHPKIIDAKTFKKIINTGLAMGSIAIINGVFFLVDAVISYRDVSEYTPHQ